VDKLWKAARENMAKVLCLMQVALNTVKTYITWMSQFEKYIIKALDNLDTAGIINNLSNLAAKRKMAFASQSQVLNAILFFCLTGLPRP